MLSKIIDLVKQKRNLFITGGGGVGKSYTLEKLREVFPTMVVTATTGIAAVNIDGETIHKWSGARLFDTPLSALVQKIRNNKEIHESILQCDILAIDEVSMLASYQLDYLDVLFRVIRASNKPFGGIQLLLFGDLYQLPPVKKGTDVIINAKKYVIDYCFKAKSWDSFNFEIVHLTKVHRQKDIAFINILNSIREGKPTNLRLLYDCNYTNAPLCATRLYPLNSKVDYWNNTQYANLSSKEYTYWAEDEFFVNRQAIDPWKCASQLSKKQIAIRDNFNKYCKAVMLLKLKVGAKVMLLYNLDVPMGLCNGACGYVIELTENSAIVEFDNGQVREITKMPFQLHSHNKLVITRKQIPLMLAYAISIHKSQGLSIDNLAIDFDGIFECGQAYVALSRATNLDTLYLKNFNENIIRVDSEVVQFYNRLKVANGT